MGTSASTRRSSVEIRANGLVVDGKQQKGAYMDLAKRSHDIDRMLAKAGVAEAKKIKLLLLGGGESGKSTFAKQMRILHMNGFKEEDLLSYRKLVHTNAATALYQILQGIYNLKISIDTLNEHDIENFQLLTNARGHFAYQMTPTIGAIMNRIWMSQAAQQAYARRVEFDILDSAKYFLDQLDRISADDYVPSPDDIVRTRAATCGIYEITFQFRNKDFNLVDVGGQRTERRKWIHCFDNVTAIMFVSSLAEYDQCLAEDPSVNRLDDSLALFGFITKNPFFSNTAVILFLNKKDIFKEKIDMTPFTAYRASYSGPNTYDAVREYILKEFTKRKPNDKTLYSYFTEATDTRNVEVVFCASMDIILAKSLANVGFT